MTRKKFLIWVLNYLVGEILHPLVIGIFLVLILTPRWEKLHRLIPAGLLVLLVLVPGLLRRLYSENIFLFHTVAILNLMTLVVLVILFYKDSLLCKLLSIIISMVVLGAAQCIATGLLTGAGIPIEMDFGDWSVLALQIMVVLISVVLYGAFVLVWNKIGKREGFQRRNILFLLFPISHMMLFWYIIHVPEPYQITPLSVGGILVGLVAELVLFYIVFIQNRQKALEKMLAEVNSAWLAEKKNYASIEKHRMHIEKLSHDINNQLMTALFLMKQNDTQEARSILEGVQGEMLCSTEDILCENPVVNAVMLEKSAECRQEGVELKTNLQLPQQLNIAPMYLCSSFSNLMDNAIWAAKECDPAQRKIKIKAALMGDYLQIKISNTALPPQKKPRREGHGYGLLILKDIAERYNGKFSGSWKNGWYTAFLMLEAVQTEIKPLCPRE